MLWNQASITFQLWRIIQAVPSSLWLCWVHQVSLKNRVFWMMKVPARTPWCLRQILNARGSAVNRNIELTTWCAITLIFYFGMILGANMESLLIMESSKYAKVRNFISDGSWSLGTSNHDLAIELRSCVARV